MISLVAAVSLIGTGLAFIDDSELEKVKASLATESDAKKRVALLENAISLRKGAPEVSVGPYYVLLGDAWCDAQDTKQARTAYSKSTPYLASLPPREKMDALNLISKKLYQSKDRAGATFYLRSAVFTARSANFAKEAMHMGTNLGRVTLWGAEQDMACARAAEDAAKLGENFFVAENYSEMGYRGFESRDYERAIHYFEAALAVPEWNEEVMRETTQHYIVSSAGYAGDWRRAQKYGPLVYAYYRNKKNDPDQAAMILNNIAFAEMNADRDAQAIVGFRRAIAETSKSNRQQLATISFNLGLTLSHLGKRAEAVEAFKVSRAHAAGFDEDREFQCDISIGLNLVEMKKPAEALLFLKRGTGVGLGGGGGLTDMIVAYEYLERCYRELGRTKEALATAKELEDGMAQELGNLEVLRVGLSGLIQELDSYGTYALIYSMLVGQALKRGDVQEAFYRAERSKARTLVDAERRTPLKVEALLPFERDNLMWLRNRVKTLHAPNPDISPEKAQVGLKLAYDELASYETFLRSDPASSFQVAQDRMKQADHAASIATLPADTILLEFVQSFSLNQNQIAVLMAWSEKGKAKFASQILKEGGKPIGIGELMTLSRDFAQACRSTSGVDPNRGSVVSVESVSKGAGERLRKILAEPLKARLGAFKRLVIVADSSIEAIPFEALPIGAGKTMIDAWEISYAFSATQFFLSQSTVVKPNPKQPLLLVANPTYGDVPETAVQPPPTRGANLSDLTPLPGTKLEAERIKAVIPGAVVLTERNATAGIVSMAMANYGMLHFATHGLFDPSNPMASSLAFARPSNSKFATELIAYDIQSMKLTARLAVLSACDTARGEFRYGEGSVGLTFAFLKAGVPAVVSSRWPVSDSTTADLMAEFYRGLARGEKVGRALRLAALATKKKHPQPYYWAPFSLFGDSRK